MIYDLHIILSSSYSDLRLSLYVKYNHCWPLPILIYVSYASYALLSGSLECLTDNLGHPTIMSVDDPHDSLGGGKKEH